MNIQNLIEAARSLRSVEGENPEYDRALVELVGAFLPGESEERYGYLYPVILDRPMPVTLEREG